MMGKQVKSRTKSQCYFFFAVVIFLLFKTTSFGSGYLQFFAMADPPVLTNLDQFTEKLQTDKRTNEGKKIAIPSL